MTRKLPPSPAVPSGLAVVAAGGGAALARAELEPALIDVVASWWPPSRAAEASPRTDAGRAVGRVLDWLQAQPGRDWAQRWQASGVSDADRDWREVTGMHRPNEAWASHYASNALIVLQAVRPGSQWLLASKRVRVWSDWTRYHDQQVYLDLGRLLVVRL